MRRQHAGEMLFKIALFLTIAFAGFGQAVHYLWNWLMPALFRLPEITYWQAMGLLGLSWLLFGGLRGFRGPGRGGGPWGDRVKGRWERMTPEEREKFRAGMRGRCGSFSPETEAQAKP